MTAGFSYDCYSQQLKKAIDETNRKCPEYRFEDGKAVNIGKHIFNYKIGTEYASGGAGGISTADDYIKFLEGLCTYKLLKPETVKLMMNIFMITN